ncbi:hypothetical protein [Muricoccus radiodurans]|uniref:hypothetical protein n=1 Tax=Muricoccus radiodurans TaxID=2231721 RepID=UPI003CE8745F
MTRPGPQPDTPAPDEEAVRVARYLSAHPRFLAEHPALYRALHPPRRVHGDNLADHMEALLAVARAETGSVAAAARAGQDLTLRAAAAAVALIGAPDPLAVVSGEWPALLGLEAATLAEERLAARCPLPAGTVERLLGGREAAVRNLPLAESAALHGETHPLIQRDALVRLPGTAPRLLVLGARSPGALPTHGATAPLRLLADALARALDAG